MYNVILPSSCCKCAHNYSVLLNIFWWRYDESFSPIKVFCYSTVWLKNKIFHLILGKSDEIKCIEKFGERCTIFNPIEPVDENITEREGECISRNFVHDQQNVCAGWVEVGYSWQQNAFWTSRLQQHF